MKRTTVLLQTSTFLFCGALATTTLADGFALIEQGVKGLGNAYAGAAASAEDASTIFFNPAGMTLLDGSQLVAGLHAIQPSTKFTDGGGSTAGGGDGGDAANLAVIPNLFFVTDINKDVKFGLGVSVPFGMGTQYEDGWKGRYQAIESAVEAININPSLAFNVTPQWSVGLGANIQYFKAKLTNAVDFSAITGGALPAGTDGFADITGTSWGFGYNLGVLFAPSEATRVGLAYRSQVKQSLKGEADFTLPAPLVGDPTMEAVFADSNITGNINLPSILSLSLFHQINDTWAVLADVTRTGWSSYDTLVIEFENPAKDPSEEENNWKNANRYSVGVTFTPSQTWTYRAGVAYDESPVPSAELRSARNPGSVRTWLALGLGYRMSDSFTFDFGYARISAKDAKINREGATGDMLIGAYASSVNIFSGQVVWMF